MSWGVWVLSPPLVVNGPQVLLVEVNLLQRDVLVTQIAKAAAKQYQIDAELDQQFAHELPAPSDRLSPIMAY